MKKDEIYLLDILQSAKIAVEYLKDTPYEVFENNTQCQDAVIRRLEMIGEASTRISNNTQQQYSELPWKKMKTMRNFLIHEYDDIDFKIVYDTVKKNLPSLVSQLEKILL